MGKFGTLFDFEFCVCINLLLCYSYIYKYVIFLNIMTLETKLEIAENNAARAGRGWMKSMLISAPVIAAASMYTAIQGGVEITPENIDSIKQSIELQKNIWPYVKSVATAGLVLGTYTMVKSKLLGTDGKKGGKLVTDGMFKLCRNPFYFSLGLAGTLLAGYMPLIDEMSNNPKHIPAVLATVGLGILSKGIHNYVKADEKLLEAKFGDDYLKYKEKTPRYIPNLLNLFKK